MEQDCVVAGSTAGRVLVFALDVNGPARIVLDRPRAKVDRKKMVDFMTQEF